jgi:hypothetical protein
MLCVIRNYFVSTMKKHEKRDEKEIKLHVLHVLHALRGEYWFKFSICPKHFCTLERQTILTFPFKANSLSIAYLPATYFF